MQKKKSFLKVGFLTLVLWLLLLKFNQGDASQLELVLASALYFVCCLPFLTYFQYQPRDVPYVPLFATLFFINYGLGIFNSYNLFWTADISRTVVVKIITLSLAGIVSMLVAFYGPFLDLFKLILPRLTIPWNPASARRLGIYTGLIGSGVLYFSIAGTVPFMFGGLINFLGDLSRMGIALLYLLLLQNKLKLKLKIFFLALLVFRLLIDLGTGSTFHVVVDLILLFFIYFYQRQRIPAAASIVAIILFITIFGVRDDFRRLTWFGGDYAKTSPMEKSLLYVKLGYQRLIGKEIKYFADDYEILAARTNILLTFGKVAELTPEFVPYWQGHSYRTIFTSFIPRFLYPEKPIKMVGQEFGHRYGFLDPFDYSTSYNLPVLVEMYVNFGPAGIIIGMFILGLIFRIFYILFNHAKSGDGGIILSSLVFMSFLNLDSDFSLMFGNVIQYIILFYLIIKFNILTSRPDSESQKQEKK